MTHAASEPPPVATFGLINQPRNLDPRIEQELDKHIDLIAQLLGYTVGNALSLRRIALQLKP